MHISASITQFNEACQIISFMHTTVLRRSSFLTWAPTDVPFCQKATRLCLMRGAFNWRVSSSHNNKLFFSVCCSFIWIVKRVKALIQLILFSGLPHFSVEPQHMSVVANVSLSLSCVAHGPPEPVRVIWLQDGAPLNSLTDPVALSPSTLNLTGIIFHPLLYKATCTQLSQTH